MSPSVPLMEEQALYELDRSEYEHVRPLFQPVSFHLTSAAVLDGFSPGKVLVDNPKNPQTAFMFSPEGCYLVGKPDNSAFNLGLNAFIYSGRLTDEWIPSLYFIFHPDSWREQLSSVLDPQPVLEMSRRHYLCNKVKVDWRDDLPDGFSVHQIDKKLLIRPRLRFPGHIAHWMTNNWGSTANFLQNGFGVVTVHDDSIVSWSLADCCSGDICELGIHTTETYRRRGLATITTAAAVDYALSNGFSTIGWHCSEDNPGSISTAEKVGFELERAYTMYYAILT